MNELKPCPFCGKNDTEIGKIEECGCQTLYAGRCRDCGAEGEAGDTRKLAVVAWNTRSDSELEEFCRFAEKEGYLDCDWYAEEPKLIDRYRISQLKGTKP